MLAGKNLIPSPGRFPWGGAGRVRDLRRVHTPAVSVVLHIAENTLSLGITDTLRAQRLPLPLRSCCKKYSHVLGMST